MALSGLSANKLFLECVLNQNHNEHQNRNSGILWFVYIHVCIAIKEIYGGGGGYNFRVRVMVFNATFSNISIISWWSVLYIIDTYVT